MPAESKPQLTDEQLKDILETYKPVALANFFYDGDGEHIDFNTFRFSDGNTILTFLITHNIKNAIHLLDEYPDLDPMIPNQEGKTALHLLFHNTRISLKACEALVSKLEDKKISVPQDIVELADSRVQQRHSAAINSEGAAAYEMIVKHNAKFAAKPEVAKTAKFTITGAKRARAEETSAAELIDLTLQDPEVQEIRALREELDARESAIKKRILDAREFKREVEAFVPGYKAHIAKRDELRAQMVRIQGHLQGMSYEEFVEYNKGLVPGLKEAITPLLDMLDAHSTATAENAAEETEDTTAVPLPTAVATSDSELLSLTTYDISDYANERFGSPSP